MSCKGQEKILSDIFVIVVIWACLPLAYLRAMSKPCKVGFYPRTHPHEHLCMSREYERPWTAFIRPISPTFFRDSGLICEMKKTRSERRMRTKERENRGLWDVLLTVCFSSASFQLLDSVQNVKEAVGEFPAASLPPPLPPYPEIGDLSLSGRTNFQFLKVLAIC